jgi:hypothetical protein
MYALTTCLVPLAWLASFLAGCVNGRDCELVGCEQGLSIDFARPLSDSGTYTITVDVDAVRTTCSVVLPPKEEPGRLCDHDEVGLRLGFLESPAPGPQARSILGIGVTSTDAKSVTVRVVRDGTEVTNTTFAPAYTKGGCDGSCSSAQKTL